MTHWKLETLLKLNGITENFNVDDFCELVKKGVFSKICFHIAENVPHTYVDNFKATFENMKNSWTSNTQFPIIILTK